MFSSASPQMLVSSARRIRTLALIPLALGVASACKETLPGPPGVGSVVVAPPSFDRALNASQKLNVAVLDADGQPLDDRPVTFNTSNATVATVSSDGTVIGVGLGNARITATAGGRSGFSDVTVVNQPVVSVVLDPPAPQSIKVGDTFTLTASPMGAGNQLLADRTVAFTSSVSAVATVAASGNRAAVITAVAPGNTTITATAEGKFATLQVNVQPLQARVATVTIIRPPTTILRVGNTRTLQVELRDAQDNVLTGRPVDWTSSNPLVATVEETTGRIVAVSPGQTTITAESDGQRGTLGLSVTLKPVGSIAVTPSPLTLLVSTNQQLFLALKDTAGGDLELNDYEGIVAWSVTNAPVASVARGGAGAVVSGREPGTTRVVARVDQRTIGKPDIADTVDVTVSAIQSIVLEPANPQVKLGQTITLQAFGLDAQGNRFPMSDLFWVSNTPTFASVSQTGVVTGLAVGTTVVRATKNGVTGQTSVSVVP